MREIDALQKQVGVHEAKVVELMTAAEEVETELSSRAEEINTLDSKRDEALAAFDAEIDSNKAELETETSKREAVFVTLPAQLAGVYNRLAQRSRDGIAVAEVINGSCTACNMSLRPQMNVEVKKGEQIITCENCSRILYIATPKEAEATAS
jgi:predicted  nucleic acid-binding Zn-ribbon protein